MVRGYRKEKGWWGGDRSPVTVTSDHVQGDDEKLHRVRNKRIFLHSLLDTMSSETLQKDFMLGNETVPSTFPRFLGTLSSLLNPSAPPSPSGVSCTSRLSRVHLCLLLSTPTCRPHLLLPRCQSGTPRNLRPGSSSRSGRPSSLVRSKPSFQEVTPFESNDHTCHLSGPPHASCRPLGPVPGTDRSWRDGVRTKT